MKHFKITVLMTFTVLIIFLLFSDSQQGPFRYRLDKEYTGPIYDPPMDRDEAKQFIKLNYSEDTDLSAQIKQYDGPYPQVKEMSDRTIANYIINILPNTCPFYENGGTKYRECLSSKVQMLKQVVSEEQFMVATDHCVTFTENYDKTSLVAFEMFDICMMAKLSI